MTKIVWIIGAVIVVGIAVAAGLIFAGGNEPQASAAESAKGSGIEAEVVPPAASQLAQPERTQAEAVSDNAVDSEPVDVAPVDTGEQTGALAVASIDELFASASSYSNKEVIVRGTIVTQCISGCTFSLEDGTGVVAVELIDDALDNVLDRGSIGKEVEVRGTVETSPHLVIVIEDPDAWRYLD